MYVMQDAEIRGLETYNQTSSLEDAAEQFSNLGAAGHLLNGNWMYIMTRR